MTILTIRTDSPEAEIAMYDNQQRSLQKTWIAHRELTIVCFKGPGSFTGLRIGITVANALAYAEDIPIVAKAGPSWQEQGIKALLSGKNEKTILPNYGAEAKTTKPRK
jgi:tRNA A37 threonylcarbamoyladenosine modification protein TsaB